MTDPRIILPPRSFQYSAIFTFVDDTRTDAQLRDAVLSAIAIASNIVGQGRAIGVQPVAFPLPGVSQ